MFTLSITERKGPKCLTKIGEDELCVNNHTALISRFNFWNTLVSYSTEEIKFSTFISFLETKRRLLFNFALTSIFGICKKKLS